MIRDMDRDRVRDRAEIALNGQMVEVVYDVYYNVQRLICICISRSVHIYVVVGAFRNHTHSTLL